MNSDRDNAGRFRAGQSGNPNGRRKKDTSVHGAVTRAVQEKITVTEQGKRKRKSKLDVATAQLVNKGAGGDTRAIKLTLDYAREAEEHAASETARAPVMTQSDHEIAGRVIERLKKLILEGNNDEDTDA